MEGTLTITGRVPLTGDGPAPAAPPAGGTAAIAGSDLLRLALARPDLAWPATADIADARNAHETNTRSQLADALRGEFDWLECDIRRAPDGSLVLQHTLHEPVGMKLEEWLAVAAASGRGAKLEVKERAALEGTLAAARRSGIPQERLIINVPPWPAADLMMIRRAFPRAIVNISPTSRQSLRAGDIVALQLAATVVGGPVMFPIRDDLLTAGIVRALRPHGRVAAWNSPALTNPGRSDHSRLRGMGVDGMIDLREPTSLRDHISTALTESAAHVFGWNPVRQALAALGYL